MEDAVAARRRPEVFDALGTANVAQPTCSPSPHVWVSGFELPRQQRNNLRGTQYGQAVERPVVEITSTLLAGKRQERVNRTGVADLPQRACAGLPHVQIGVTETVDEHVDYVGARESPQDSRCQESIARRHGPIEKSADEPIDVTREAHLQGISGS
jgi:hypothetical protein